MKNILTKDFRYCLVGKIKGLETEVRRSRDRIFIKESECYRNETAMTKRFIGNDVRHHLLAYAFMKGVPYNVLEKKCSTEKKPDVGLLLLIIHSHLYTYLRAKVTIDHIKAWLEGTEIADKSVLIKAQILGATQ